MKRPDVERTLASLKDFQRRTVDYAFERLWTDEDRVKRFLVADEVGLGKTMVAKGVIARTVEHLWESEERIDIVYICSNSQIARQNLSRLNVVGGTELKHADRLTLLPKAIRDLRDRRVNFVSFTPGTSFNVGYSGGKYEERVLLYWMLAEAWGADAVHATRWKRFFEGGMSRENFEAALAWFDRSSLDHALCQAFGTAIDSTTGPGGQPLRVEIDECVQDFNYLRGKPKPHLSDRRYRLIGTLRGLVARAAVDHLEPDLVILDEFQRFKDLLDGADDEGARLANAIFDHPSARVLLLSATPYKMYTLPDEPDGDDHYSDFVRTTRFLAGDDRAHVVEQSLRTMRESLVSGGDDGLAVAARDRVQHELRRVMCRTERLASTPDRDGMLTDKPLPGLALSPDDVRSWRVLDDVARLVDTHDVFEYWRSSPYPLNLMERGAYQVRARFHAAAERQDAGVATALSSGAGLLDWDDIHHYRAVDPGNAKMRGLCADVLDRQTWRLAWLPPSLPYYDLGGAYAQPDLQSFTKRLVFSAWSVVPKAISVVMSYEAERRTLEAARLARTYDDRPLAPPLQFRMAGDRVAGMSTLALLYPSLTLARAGDPLDVARATAEIPLNRTRLADAVRARVSALVDRLPTGDTTSERVDQSWYWAAPFLLDEVVSPEEQKPVRNSLSRWSQQDDDHESRLIAHLRTAQAVTSLELGRRPDDLVDVLTTMAIAAPGTCALRALGRVAGGPKRWAHPELRRHAFDVAQGLRSLFNKPEIIALVRAQDDESYWRAVLEHALDGCLQAVLDEYAHVLLESEGLIDATPLTRSRSISEAMVEALSTRTATNAVDDVRVSDGQIRVVDRHMSSHFAARFGRAETSDKAAVRESTIRMAYNSPFRPFVLASTSVGQEGLDFHTYSHAVVHWNLPGNPVDLEQREGRVHRYKGHAVRKNVAARHRAAALALHDDPWDAVFAAAREARRPGASDIEPFWIATAPDGAQIERYIAAMPLSREEQQRDRLLRTVGAYRLVIGQPRQDDLLRYAGEAGMRLAIDLAPPRDPASHP